MNLNELNKLKEVIDLAIVEEKEREKEDYKKQKHNFFVKGDWITDGKDIGIVGWTDEDGYLGLDIKNGDGGFRAPCKRNNYQLLSEELVDYYTGKTTITIEVTGEDIEAFYMSYLGVKNVNPHPLKTKLMEAFDSARLPLDDNDK